jgi:hypothetical protein
MSTSSRAASDTLAVRAGTGAALMVVWLVVGPRMPDSSVSAAVTWYVATTGLLLVVAMWSLVPWLSAEPGDPRPERVALPVQHGPFEKGWRAGRVLAS